jgi:hypothetical protein
MALLLVPLGLPMIVLGGYQLVLELIWPASHYHVEILIRAFQNMLIGIGIILVSAGWFAHRTQTIYLGTLIAASGLAIIVMRYSFRHL